MLIREMHLGFDPTFRNASVLKPVISSAIEIETMLDLETDLNRNRKIYDLVTAIRSDMPAPQDVNAVPFDEFVAGYLLSPSRLPGATFIALDTVSGEYVGFSDLLDYGNNRLMAGLTGVRREYRGRGIASALKKYGCWFARAHGYNGITTFNAADNTAIAAVNKTFGFIEMFSWLHYEKLVSDE